jgi:hypothetical protein
MKTEEIDRSKAQDIAPPLEQCSTPPTHNTTHNATLTCKRGKAKARRASILVSEPMDAREMVAWVKHRGGAKKGLL